MQAQLYEIDPGTDTAWQRPEVMAQRLEVTTRTIRAMVSRGELERMEANGRIYVRRAQLRTVDPRGTDPDSTVPEPLPDPHLPAIVQRLQVALVEVTREHAATVAALNAELRAEAAERGRIQVEAAEVRLLAEVATRDAERAQAHAEALAAELSTERLRRATVARYAAALSAAPWYAWRRRRAIRAHLDGVELVGLPGAS